jgi:hypothetical protein
VGVQLLVNIGEREGRDGDGRMFKSVVAPFFFPIDRRDLVKWDEEVPV